MITIRITRFGVLVGWVRCDPRTGVCRADAAVPSYIVADILVTYSRDNVLFGENGDGWRWEEAEAHRETHPLRLGDGPNGDGPPTRPLASNPETIRLVETGARTAPLPRSTPPA